MPIETTCPGCGRKLQVAAEHAGKQARCPLCNEIYAVPIATNLETSTSPQPVRPSAWWMRTPEGQTYGPVEKAELDSWVAEGRVSAECFLSSEANSQWLNADTVFPVLKVAASSPLATSSRHGERYIAGHRGGLILALGIVSWLVGCPIFGICAWVMGSADLREIRAGQMDAGGAGLTQAGQIIGMLHAMLSIVVIVVVVFVLIFGVGWW